MLIEVKKHNLMELLQLDIKKYKQYHVIINNKYKNSQPSIFYTALSRGYKTIAFEDLDDDILYQLKEDN